MGVLSGALGLVLRRDIKGDGPSSTQDNVIDSRQWVPCNSQCFNCFSERNGKMDVVQPAAYRVHVSTCMRLLLTRYRFYWRQAPGFVHAKMRNVPKRVRTYSVKTRRILQGVSGRSTHPARQRLSSQGSLPRGRTWGANPSSPPATPRPYGA